MKFAVMMHTTPTHSKALSEEEVSAIEAIRIVAGRPVSSTGPVAASSSGV